jgi:hypothetical protein
MNAGAAAAPAAPLPAAIATTDHRVRPSTASIWEDHP